MTGSASCTGTTGTGCAASVVDGASLTLTAAATAGSVFTGWSGLCTGTSPTCTLTAFDHALAVANFRAAPAPVLQYYHVDTLGSVRAVTDASGTVLERHDYRPFGEDNQALPAPGANAARFLGQQRDQTKLDYFGARYLDMHTGRFGGVDPVLSPAALVFPQKFNRYAYAQNNPLRFSDPSGMDSSIIRPLLPGGSFGGNQDDTQITEDAPRDHPDPGLASEYDGNARENAVCMGWDDECGTAGFDNFVAQYEAARDQEAEGFFASVEVGASVTIDLNNPQAGPLPPEGHYVAISYWPTGAKDFGHIGIAVDSKDTHGFSTDDIHAPWWERLFWNPQGRIEDDAIMHPGQTPIMLYLSITKDQADAMNSYIFGRGQPGQAGNYNLMFNNCADYVEDVLHAGSVGGIPHNEIFGPMILWGVLQYEQSLR